MQVRGRTEGWNKEETCKDLALDFGSPIQGLSDTCRDGVAAAGSNGRCRTASGKETAGRIDAVVPPAMAHCGVGWVGKIWRAAVLMGWVDDDFAVVLTGVGGQSAGFG